RPLAAPFAGALETGWIEDITLDDVAAAAGTTRQTVIRLFGGKEGLLSDLAERMNEEAMTGRAPRPGAGPPAAVHGVLQDYEAIGDMILRLLAQEGRYAPLSTMLDRGRGWHR